MWDISFLRNIDRAEANSSQSANMWVFEILCKLSMHIEIFPLEKYSNVNIMVKF